ncbi:hypothetical protein [Caldimonas brevitalea]|uniref:General secretion pathway protein K n=1 Tax=Caldimonas brevitalea TaxID=413882 RepID=A0A0G3BJY9_9BURK|nr:hypothetical protein [Caldimonas brevitalea]AKJ29732.1 general secretion pathway protein K [Caldimonas brevitalea]
MLLHALWLLLAACAALTTMLTLASRAALETGAAEQQVQTELAQESAVEQVIYELVTQGQVSPWLQGPQTGRRLEIGAQAVDVTVQHVAGLLDAGMADAKVAATLLAARLGRDASPVLQRLLDARARRGARPFGSYAELQAVLQLADEQFACLYPDLTLFSGRSEPDPEHAAPRLRQLLRLAPRQASGPSAMEAQATPAGSTFRLLATPVGTGGQALVAEVAITGLVRPSHLVRSWTFRPQRAATDPCG